MCTELQIFKLLEEHLAGNAPATPLLLTGSSGHGKTAMVAKWFVACPSIHTTQHYSLFSPLCRIEHLQSSEGDRLLIMYHFVKCLGAPSAEYANIVRRFIQKVVNSYLLLVISAIGACRSSHMIQ